jgi:hypothetical protein
MLLRMTGREVPGNGANEVQQLQYERRACGE